ncbi:toll/interleukin-1 receptor domain-containing protein [Streptomyces sp. NPDC004838]
MGAVPLGPRNSEDPSASPEQGKDFPYDVCFSFAGEDRPYVARVAQILKDKGVRVFYDDYEKSTLWGKDLYEHLSWVYQRSARYCVIFISAAYAEKMWTNHERRNAQDRALTEAREYILPARFDETKIPGMRDSAGFIDLRDMAPSNLADLISAKILSSTGRSLAVPNGQEIVNRSGLTVGESPVKGIGILRVSASRIRGAIALRAVRPRAEFCGKEHVITWSGVHEFALPVGRCDVSVFFPYVQGARCCAASIAVEITLENIVEVEYRAPLWMFNSGTVKARYVRRDQSSL